ncbi:MAG: hypothetical protein WC674_02360 [Candidatus Krumholzibacteriia bacterium]
MSRIARVFRIFGTVLSYLQHGRLIIPLLLYFLVQLSLICLYVWSGARAAGLWTLLRPGMDPEIVTHYPEHLFFMESILGRFDIPLEIFILVLAQGATVLLVAAAAKRESMGVRKSLGAAGRRYLHLVIAAAAASVAMFVCFRYPMALLDGIAGIPRGFGAGASALICVVLQAFLLYAIPFILIEGRSAPDALRRSFGFAGRHFAESFLFALVPFLLTVPTLLLSLNPQAIMVQISPEFLVHVQIAGEAIQFITTYLLVGGLTIFFVETRNTGEEQ